MASTKVSFSNDKGILLQGKIDLPVDQTPHNFVIFAHCFTCSKNLRAVRILSQAMTRNGFGVLRFDFTGLGESDGDFSESTFSANVDDLVSASIFLKENYLPPSLIIGHSLGGAAAILAADQIPTVKAVATIGAPSDPSHVKHLFGEQLDEIIESGDSKVYLAGRPFKIKKQFLDDLKEHRLLSILESMRKALLILHSPQDMTVEIEHAEFLYKAAHHPKSFISLDGADHLVSKPEDAEYAARVISNWAMRYIDIPEEDRLRTSHQVAARLEAEDGFTTQIQAGKHSLMADEPISYGGNNFGPSPYEFVSAGLSACTAMTLQMYARRKKWDLQEVEVHTSHQKIHAVDCEHCEQKTDKIDQFLREIKLIGNLDDKQKERLLQIADRCPVHKSLESEASIKTTEF